MILDTRPLRLRTPPPRRRPQPVPAELVDAWADRITQLVDRLAERWWEELSVSLPK